MKINYLFFLIIILISMILCSCAASKHLKKDEYIDFNKLDKRQTRQLKKKLIGYDIQKLQTSVNLSNPRKAFYKIENKKYFFIVQTKADEGFFRGKDTFKVIIKADSNDRISSVEEVCVYNDSWVLFNERYFPDALITWSCNKNGTLPKVYHYREIIDMSE